MALSAAVEEVAAASAEELEALAAENAGLRKRLAQAEEAAQEAAGEMERVQGEYMALALQIGRAAAAGAEEEEEEELAAFL